VDAPAYQSHVEALYADLIALGDGVVEGGEHYYMTGDESLVSADRHTTILPLTMAPDAEEVVEQVHVVVDEAGAMPSFEVFVTGDASFEAEAIVLAEETMKTGESIGIMVALVILALVFGAVAAAVLPVALGIVSVIGALGLTALVGQTMELSFFVTNIITMMGLAVGIDYSLFVLSRYREERERGLEKIDAIAAAGATASRAVLFSGITVVLALIGLVIFPLSIFQSFGIGAILVVMVAVLASLTLLPAVLGLFGDRVNAIRIRVPFIQRRKTEQTAVAAGGFWVRTTRIVTRRPVVSLVIAGGLLIAAAVPYFGGDMGMSGISGLPDGLRAKQGFLVLQEEFGFGQDEPAVIVVDGQTDSEAVLQGVAGLEATLASDPNFASSNLQVFAEADLSVLSVRVAGDPLGKQAMTAVEQLRSEYIPAAFADAPATVLVTGGTAEMLDFNATTASYTPIIFGFVLALSFVLLTVAFRSVVVPAASIVMNLLSVGAAYGLIVLVFQRGVGASLLGFQQVDVIESWLPLFLFAILFGLSMDYQVFLLSRIRERFKQTGDNTESVSFGLSSTGRLITGAALIMVAVFGGFALGDMVMFQQMGFGLAIAVLVDATIVRSVLVPATLTILGNRSWYMPKWLEWIPNVSIGEGEHVEVEPVREPERVRPLEQPVLVPVPVYVEEDLLG
jgi:RND superfamily putative drug exporter